MRVAFKRVSGNEKTGPIPVTTSGRESCPKSCPYYNEGCYANYSFLGLYWKRLNEGKTKTIEWEELIRKIKRLPRGQIWRHNQAGDLPGLDGKIDLQKFDALVQANKGRRGFTYTHKPLTKVNATAILAANKQGFTVNLSTGSLEEADRTADLNIGPVVTVIPEAPNANNPRQLKTPAGRHVVICPAQYTEDLDCGRCQLCQKGNRKSIVGFWAHGAGRHHIVKEAKRRLNVIK